MIVDMALTVIAHYQDLASMPSGAPADVAADRTAAIDMKEVLMHGAQYLLACWNNGTGTVVTHVASQEALSSTSPGVEWIAPEQVSPPPPCSPCNCTLFPGSKRTSPRVDIRYSLRRLHTHGNGTTAFQGLCYTHAYTTVSPCVLVTDGVVLACSLVRRFGT